MPNTALHPADSPLARSATKAILAPARLSAHRVELARMVRRGCFVRLADAPAVFSIRLADHEAGAAWPAPLFLDTPHGAIEIADGARLIQGLTGIHPGLAQSPGAQGTPWFAAALAGRLAGTPFAGVHIAASGAGPGMDDSCCLRLTLRSRRHLLSVLARAPAAAWLDFLARSDWSFERTPAAHWLAAQSQATIRIAQHTLPAGVLRTLAPGDVIVPDSPLFGTGGEGRMRLGHRDLLVRYAAPNSIEVMDTNGAPT